MIERDRLAVGRPLEAPDREGARRQSSRFLGARRVRDGGEIEMRHTVFLIDDLELPILLVAILGRIRLGIGHRERDLFSVRRPRESVDSVVSRRELARFAA
jgi:hypothetical protein